MKHLWSSGASRDSSRRRRVPTKNNDGSVTALHPHPRANRKHGDPTTQTLNSAWIRDELICAQAQNLAPPVTASVCGRDPALKPPQHVPHTERFAHVGNNHVTRPERLPPELALSSTLRKERTLTAVDNRFRGEVD